MGRAAPPRSRGRNELFSADRECRLGKSFCELFEVEVLDSPLFLEANPQVSFDDPGEKEGGGGESRNNRVRKRK